MSTFTERKRSPLKSPPKRTTSSAANSASNTPQRRKISTTPSRPLHQQENDHSNITQNITLIREFLEECGISKLFAEKYANNFVTKEKMNSVSQFETATRDRLKQAMIGSSVETYHRELIFRKLINRQSAGVATKMRSSVERAQQSRDDTIHTPGPLRLLTRTSKGSELLQTISNGALCKAIYFFNTTTSPSTSTGGISFGCRALRPLIKTHFNPILRNISHSNEESHVTWLERERYELYRQRLHYSGCAHTTAIEIARFYSGKIGDSVEIEMEDKRQTTPWERVLTKKVYCIHKIESPLYTFQLDPMNVELEDSAMIEVKAIRSIQQAKDFLLAFGTHFLLTDHVIGSTYMRIGEIDTSSDLRYKDLEEIEYDFCKSNHDGTDHDIDDVPNTLSVSDKVDVLTVNDLLSTQQKSVKSASCPNYQCVITHDVLGPSSTAGNIQAYKRAITPSLSMSQTNSHTPMPAVAVINDSFDPYSLTASVVVRPIWTVLETILITPQSTESVKNQMLVILRLLKQAYVDLIKTQQKRIEPFLESLVEQTVQELMTNSEQEGISSNTTSVMDTASWIAFKLDATKDLEEARKMVNAMTNESLREAVQLWCDDANTAQLRYGHISTWNTSQITNMKELFKDRHDFNEFLNLWDVSRVVSMEGMFSGATSFNQPLDRWNTQSVTSLRRCFYNASSFNQPLNSWNVNKVNDMMFTFCGATRFNQLLDCWNVYNVINMDGMFFNAYTFNQSINNWNVSNVINMSCMFCNTNNFNQSLSKWDVSNVTTMNWMFSKASAFNQPLDNWHVDNVTNMALMFSNTKAFNQQLMSWNISKVINMNEMFDNALSFNQPVLSVWNIQHVINKDNMFRGAANSQYIQEED